MAGDEAGRETPGASVLDVLQKPDSRSGDGEQTADMQIFQSLEDAHARSLESSGGKRASDNASQLQLVLDEIEREVQTKAERQRKGVSHLEVLSVQLENGRVTEAEEVQRRLRVRGKMVDDLHEEMAQMHESLVRVHGSRINEMETNSSRFVDYPALERRLETAEKTLHRLNLECPALQAQMPAIARGIEEFEDRRRETDRLVDTCWESAQGALDKYLQELCAEFDRALAPSTANIEALRAEMARCQHELEALNRPDAQRLRAGGTGRSSRSNDGHMSRPGSAVAGAPDGGGRRTGGQSGAQLSRNKQTLQQGRPTSAGGVLTSQRARSRGLSDRDAHQHHRHRRGTDHDPRPPRLLVGMGDVDGGIVPVTRPGSAGQRHPRHSTPRTLPVASRQLG